MIEKAESSDASEDVAAMHLPLVTDKGVMEEEEGELERTVQRWISNKNITNREGVVVEGEVPAEWQ